MKMAISVEIICPKEINYIIEFLHFFINCSNEVRVCELEQSAYFNMSEFYSEGCVDVK